MNRLSLGVAVSALAVAGAVPMSVGAAAASSRLAWQQLVHSGATSTARSVAIAGDLVTAAGFTSDASSRRHLTVRTSKVSSGALVWSDVLPQAGVLSDVAAGEGAVVAAGFAYGADQASGRFVRAYDAATGRVRWTDAPAAATDEQSAAQTVAIGGGRVYVGGYSGSCTYFGAPGCVATVHAYDAATGAPAWDSSFGLPTAFGVISALVVTDGHVVAAGRTGSPVGLDQGGLLVQSFDAATGVPDWTAPVTTSTAPAGEAYEGATSVAVGHGIVAVGGATGSITGTSAFEVRTFDARTGLPGWHDVVAGGERPDRVDGIAFTAQRLVAVGRTSQPGGEEAWTVRAYDPATGKLAWRDRVSSAGKEPENAGSQLEAATAVVTAGSRAYVVGRVGRHCDGVEFADCDLLVRAYDERDGHPAWSDRYNRAGHDDVGLDAALTDGRLVVSGLSAAVYPLGEEPNWLLRAYRP
jgi:outer membrane protein assembly factor BamB